MKAGLMARQFDVDGRLVTVENTGSGNVNDTYLAIFRTTFSEHRFILQKLNANVFAEPEVIMHNMRTLTDHVHRRLEDEAHLADRIWQLPRVIPSRDGKDFVVDGDGAYWRAISHIASAHSYERAQGMEHAYEAGFVLGQFQRLISDLPADSLNITIDGFHVTPRYFEKLDRAMSTREGQERCCSSAEAERCHNFITARRDWCSVLEQAKERGELQVRPIHGDPKIANIMIDDATGKGTCIVDLDTVMPGLAHYDIGDCMRSSCNPAGEETAQLNHVYFDTDLFEAIYKGYSVYAREFLTDADRHYIYDSIRLVAFELGLRFFADFLAGDVYFKTRYDSHNLNRAAVQFKLVESIETRENLIRKVIESV